MIIEKISDRNIVFRHKPADWDLCIHLIIAKHHNYVIDTGLGANSVQPVKEYLKDSGKPIILINTHHHWDHVWGNHAFAPCTIIAHHLCREAMDARWEEMLSRNRQFLDGDAQKCLPNLVFDETLCFPEDGIRLLHTPGHTVDCISVLDEEERVLNVGDNIGDTMEELVPSLDIEAAQYRDTLLRYKKLGDTTIVSGHNILTDHKVFDTLLAKL